MAKNRPYLVRTRIERGGDSDADHDKAVDNRPERSVKLQHCTNLEIRIGEYAELPEIGTATWKGREKKGAARFWQRRLTKCKASHESGQWLLSGRTAALVLPATFVVLGGLGHNRTAAWDWGLLLLPSAVVVFWVLLLIVVDLGIQGVSEN